MWLYSYLHIFSKNFSSPYYEGFRGTYFLQTLGPGVQGLEAGEKQIDKKSIFLNCLILNDGIFGCKKRKTVISRLPHDNDSK